MPSETPFPADLTARLQRWGLGDDAALAEVVDLAYGELRAIAAGYMRRESSGHTLQATALVNELYLRLARVNNANFTSRQHFYAFAAHLMRLVLVDHSRRNHAAKRNDGEVRVPLHEDLAWVSAGGDDALALDLALDQLEALDERKVRAVELRYFLGCTNQETADLLGVSRPTVDRDLEFAKAWAVSKAQSRMPLIQRVEELFHQAKALPPGTDVPAFVTAQSTGDAGLAAEVMGLLEADEALRKAKKPGAPPQPLERVSLEGQTAGPYRIERLIGRGGMGAVYLAHRADGHFDQKVAVKLIGLPFEPEPFRDRFRQERQILANLNHPNITRLLDGGVTSAGQLYLAMEYVDGVRIDEYAVQHALPLIERIRLFQDVCGAVQYAHQNLVVHRDIKPSNILVGPGGAAKLLDFGTAKLIAGQEITQTGPGLMTPAYASPEQLRGESVTTLSDVFSLGVVLFELISGSKPFGEDFIGRLTGSLTPAFRPDVPEDLRRICAKSLAADPFERYSSVERFSEDLGRFLEGKPVLARPPAAFYVIAKFLRRNSLFVGLAAAAVIALCAVTAAALHQRRLAEERYADMRSVTTSLLFELKDAIQDVPGSTKAQQILANRALKNLDKLAASSNPDPALQLELSEAYRQLGEIQGDPYSQNLGDAKGSLASLTKALAIAAPVARRLSGDPVWMRETGLIERTIAEVEVGAGNPTEALRHAQAATSEFDKMTPLTRDPAYLAEAAATHGVLGDLLGQHGIASMGDTTGAALQYRRALELDQMAAGLSPSYVRAIRGGAIFGMKLGDLTRVTDPETALVEFQKSIAGMDRLPEKDRALPLNQRLRAYMVRKRGSALSDLQRWPEAEASFEEAVAFCQAQVTADPKDLRGVVDLAAAWNELAWAHYLSGGYEAARTGYAKFTSLLEGLVESDPGNGSWRAALAYSKFHLATTLNRLNQPKEAANLARQSVAVLGPLADRNDATQQELEYGAEAFTSIEPASYRDPPRAVRLAQRRLTASGANDVTGLSLLAEAYQAAGEQRQAQAVARKALAFMTASKGRARGMRAGLESILNKPQGGAR